MSKEVAGEDEGVTPTECIADGRAPVPDKMSFLKWQAWRRREGRRPTRRRDGRGLPTGEEIALWKAIVAEYYGETAEYDGEENEEDEDDDDEESSELEPHNLRLAGAVGPFFLSQYGRDSTLVHFSGHARTAFWVGLLELR